MYLFKRKHDAPENEQSEEVAYWRKANQIREWFAENIGVENCKEIPVTKENLEDLRDNCLAVLFDRTNADSLLPTSSGFFFGTTDYDEWYFEQVNDTVDMLNTVLETTDWDHEYIYYYEWW